MSEQKVIYEISLSPSVKKLLWAFAIGIILNAIPQDVLPPKAHAAYPFPSSFSIKHEVTGCAKVCGKGRLY